ncbi:MAG: hypothetical protein AAF125_13210 [Chloroflexota bacterium]
MIISIDWASNTKDTIVMTCHDEWHWEDFFNTWDICMRVAQRGTTPVNIIINANPSCGLPAGTPRQLMELAKLELPSFHRVVFVRNDALIAATVRLLQSHCAEYAERYFHTWTIEEAIELCASKRTV